jgi:hypothetical protein
MSATAAAFPGSGHATDDPEAAGGLAPDATAVDASLTEGAITLSAGAKSVAILASASGSPTIISSLMTDQLGFAALKTSKSFLAKCLSWRRAPSLSKIAAALPPGPRPLSKLHQSSTACLVKGEDECHTKTPLWGNIQ